MQVVDVVIVLAIVFKFEIAFAEFPYPKLFVINFLPFWLPIRHLHIVPQIIVVVYYRFLSSLEATTPKCAYT